MHLLNMYSCSSFWQVFSVGVNTPFVTLQLSLLCQGETHLHKRTETYSFVSKHPASDGNFVLTWFCVSVFNLMSIN